ncbi:hypothetical protein AB0F07_35175 [Streptomyces fructofermentans]|uniref:hypothetical protein n=1 Tax=Streptomyces fructofermentans TaxID=152141 RepID=UPI003406B2A3
MDTERPGNDAAEAADEDRPRRRRSPLAVVSVAAAVLLAGGGGAYYATTAAGGGDGGNGSAAPGGDGTPEPLVLDGGTGGGTNGIAPGEPDPNGVFYRADGKLPAGPSSAAVRHARGEVTAAEVKRLAKALGVEGTPKKEGGAWKVGATKDGFGPGLRVSGEAPGSWAFNRFAPRTDDCRSTTVCEDRPTGKSGADPVGEARAKKAAATVLRAVGQDDAKLDASALIGSVRVVDAQPRFGGLPTYGWATGVQIAPDGQVVGGSGQLKAPVKGDTYPVVGAREALDLLNRSGGGGARGGIGGCASPVPLEDGEQSPCGASGTATAAPRPASVPVEGAVFGLAAHQVDGRQALVPSWLFEVRPAGATENSVVAHPAVDPKYLAEAPGGGTSATPRPSGRDGNKEHDVRVEGYSADGRELTVRFTGGVCSDYSASADEGGGTVEVRVIAKPWEGEVCILMAKVFHETIRLDEPLGDRKVAGTDGHAVPDEKNLPEPATPSAR